MRVVNKKKASRSFYADFLITSNWQQLSQTHMTPDLFVPIKAFYKINVIAIYSMCVTFSLLYKALESH